MGLIERKERLVRQIIRLRRAERSAPENRDIAEVRAELERELGETVAQRLAARVLGISHTALQRWIENGEVATVYTEGGKQEIPVVALLDLYEAVEAQRRSGARTRHVLEPSILEGRERARRLNRRELVRGTEDSIDLGHRLAELRSLAYHRALARRLRRPMVDEARHLVWRWRDEGKMDSRYAEQWESILSRPVRQIARAITADTPEARDLRQNSPFAGLLSEAERRKILQEIR